MMSWQIYTAVCVFALSLAIVLQRVVIHKDKLNPYAYAVFFQGVVGLLVTIIAAINGFDITGLQDYALLGTVSIFAFGAGHIAYAKTLQKAEASVFSVLFATHALWVMAVGILFLQESLSFMQVAGGVLVFASLLLVIKRFNKASLQQGLGYGLLTGLLFGIAISSWSYVGRYTDALTWSAVSFLGGAAAAILFKPALATKIRPMLTPAMLAKMTLLAAIYGIGSVAMLFAYRDGSFAVVSPLRQTGVLVTTLLALLLLPSERTMIPRKVIAAMLCTVGALLLVL